MSERRNILFVDDNSNILQSMQRQLKREYAVQTALSGAEALAFLESGTEFAVVVSDMRMPEMDGIEFLKKLHVRAPSTVRIMLTGNADQTTAVQAVNEANVFRFLNKPVDVAALRKALEDGVELYELKVAEQELLNNTVKGLTELLSELLSFVDPALHGTAVTLQMSVREVAKQLNILEPWELEVAALLSRVGVVALPPELRAKLSGEKMLSAEEESLYRAHPSSAAAFLSSIPRLQTVAEMVRYQNKNFDGSGHPTDEISGEDIPLGARVLRVLNELSERSKSGVSPENALARLAEVPAGQLDPEAVEAVTAALRPRLDLLKEGEEFASGGVEHGHGGGDSELRKLYSTPEACKISQLEVGHIPIKELRSLTGVLVLPAGQVLTEASLLKIKNYHHESPLAEPVLVVKKVDES